MSNDKAIILIDKRRFVDFKTSVPEEQALFFESVQKAHGWRTTKVGEHKNQTISIEMMMQEEK